MVSPVSFPQPLLAQGINLISRLFYYTPISVDPIQKKVTLVNGYDRADKQTSTDTLLTDLLALPYYLLGYARHNQQDEWHYNPLTRHVERILPKSL